jgi:hypothetical protein
MRQSVLAFSSYFFGAFTHRGGRDARVPVRFRYAEFFFLFRYAEFFFLSATRKFFSLAAKRRPTGTRASPPPQCLWKTKEFCRNAKTGWRTFADTFWRSVHTFLVLLRTKAGGTPAFQSAPLRGELMWYNKGGTLFLFVIVLWCPANTCTRPAERVTSHSI